ncbi:hypothetical protein CBL_12369 [Carabus blaptoides fortunei]
MCKLVVGVASWYCSEESPSLQQFASATEADDYKILITSITVPPLLPTSSPHPPQPPSPSVANTPAADRKETNRYPHPCTTKVRMRKNMVRGTAARRLSSTLKPVHFLFQLEPIS